MGMIRHASIILCLFMLCACGSKTTVILLPEDDGRTGAVVIKNQSSSTTLDRPYTAAQVTDNTSAFLAEPIDPALVNHEYQLLLNAEPTKPVRFILYFEHDSTRLTKPSSLLIPQILKVAKEREPSEISIIGHTDSKGSVKYNHQLALERAQAVGNILKEADITLKNLYIESHGENDPLVITGDNVSEVKNRRVEAMIR